ncbi:MAG: trans-sulfuration enzyme family protein, partial [Planktomarina sp.]
HRSDNIYLRDNNDTVRVAEGLLAKFDNAQAALLFPNGMAAIAAVFRALPTGSTILVQSQIYWGTTAWLRGFCDRRGMTLEEADLSDAAVLSAACAYHSPDLVFIETPSNPWLRVTDIAGAAIAAHAVGAKLVVDGTAATPILTRALDLGADIVMHSATKGINGHSDVLAGVLATNDPDDAIWQAIAVDRHDAGAVISPFDAWLLIRGMRTLPLRVERMSENALAVSEFLASHDHVDQVMYPGIASHVGHDVAARQMRGGFGSLLSVVVRGDQAAALAVAGRLNLFHRATSLGGVESLVEHRYTIEPHTGIPPNLLRLSIGIEAVEDLIADLDQALRGA